jgi:hypothetical protein
MTKKILNSLTLFSLLLLFSCTEEDKCWNFTVSKVTYTLYMDDILSKSEPVVTETEKCNMTEKEAKTYARSMEKNITSGTDPSDANFTYKIITTVSYNEKNLTP